MSLQPSLQFISIADDATGLTVRDVTGNYSASNPGGYGAPNTSQAEVVALFFKTRSLGALTSWATLRQVPDFGDILLLPSQFPSVAGSLFHDGVYDMEYHVATALGNITILPGGKSFLLADADVLLAGVSGIVLDSDPSKIYKINRTAPPTATGATVTEAFPSTADANQVNVLKTYMGTLQVLASTEGYKCLLQDIATWPLSQCDHLEYKDIWKRYLYRITMEAKFSQKQLLDAHNLAVRLKSYCECQSTCRC